MRPTAPSSNNTFFYNWSAQYHYLSIGTVVLVHICENHEKIVSIIAFNVNVNLISADKNHLYGFRVKTLK